MKDPQREDLENPRNRRARGNTFAFLAVTLAVVSSNIRKLFLFVQKKQESTSSRKSRSRLRPEKAGVDGAYHLEEQQVDRPPRCESSRDHD